MNQDIDELLARYYEGESTLEEEKQLRQFFQQEPIPAHLRSHAPHFRYFTVARQEHPSATFNDRLAEKLMMPERGRVIRFTTWSLRIAAGIALLVVGFAGGLVYNQWHVAGPGALMATFSGEATPATAMKKVLAFEQLPKTSASERIQAVNQSVELTAADQDITQLLINTLNFDANVNVRMAACQALLRLEQEPGVREALIQSLTIQTDPNVQITLIDMLVSIKEKRAIEQIQRLAGNEQALEAVRLKAVEGASRLSQEQQAAS